MRQQGFGHGGEAVGADVVSDAVVFAGQAIQKVAFQRFFGGKANAVDKAVKLWPDRRQVGHELGDGCVAAHIAVKNQFGVKLGGKAGDAVFEALAHIAEGQLGTFTVAGFGDAVGDGAVAQNAGDQKFFAG